MSDKKIVDQEKVLCYDMQTLQEVIPIGKNNLYNLVHSKDFPKIVVGRRIIVPKVALEKWLQSSSATQLVV